MSFILYKENHKTIRNEIYKLKAKIRSCGISEFIWNYDLIKYKQ